jgi:predicted N-formylglutamate amidohydrolase
MNTHWAIDIGALKLAASLSSDNFSAVVWAKYSRLLCDVNRTPGISTVFRKEGDG